MLDKFVDDPSILITYDIERKVWIAWQGKWIDVGNIYYLRAKAIAESRNVCKLCQDLRGCDFNGERCSILS